MGRRPRRQVRRWCHPVGHEVCPVVVRGTNGLYGFNPPEKHLGRQDGIGRESVAEMDLEPQNGEARRIGVGRRITQHVSVMVANRRQADEAVQTGAMSASVVAHMRAADCYSRKP